MNWQNLVHDAIYCSHVHDIFAPDVRQVIIGDGVDINCPACLRAMKDEGWGTALFTHTQQLLITEQTEDIEKVGHEGHEGTRRTIDDG